MLRAPGGVTAAYAGELVLELESVDTDRRQRTTYDFGRERVHDRRDEALAELDRLFGPLPEAPGASLMCAGPAVPGFSDPALFSRGRALLDAGCAAGNAGGIRAIAVARPIWSDLQRQRQGS